MKYIGMILMACMLLAACSTEDDVNEIFTGKRFKITGLTYNGQKTVKDVKEFYAVNDTYWIAFSQMAVTGVLQPGMTVEGTWNADGSNRQLTIKLTSPQNADGASDICNKVFNILKNATSYSGDSNVLRIKRDNSSYIELSSL